jgi:hypothetical protein
MATAFRFAGAPIKRPARTTADKLPLVLSYGGHDPDGERVGFGHVGTRTHEFNARIPQGKNKRHIAG